MTMIAELMREVAEINTANGWRTPHPADPADTARVMAELMLIVTEVSEAAEDVRAGHAPTDQWYTISGELVERCKHDVGADWCAHEHPEHPTWTGVTPKVNGIPSELADVVIRCLDMADKYGIDLDGAIREKLMSNRVRGFRHGGKVI